MKAGPYNVIHLKLQICNVIHMYCIVVYYIKNELCKVVSKCYNYLKDKFM